MYERSLGYMRPQAVYVLCIWTECRLLYGLIYTSPFTQIPIWINNLDCNLQMLAEPSWITIRIWAAHYTWPGNLTIWCSISLYVSPDNSFICASHKLCQLSLTILQYIIISINVIFKQLQAYAIAYFNLLSQFLVSLMKQLCLDLYGVQRSKLATLTVNT